MFSFISNRHRRYPGLHILTLGAALLCGCATASEVAVPPGNPAAEKAPGTAQIVTAPPMVTSPTTAEGTIAVAFSYQITASQEPTSYAASGLPSGLSVNGTTGVITGTPLAAGSSSVTISAENALGTGSGNLSITIAGASGPPVISSPSVASATVGLAFSYQISASHEPFSYSAVGLPTGLSLAVTTGQISGTPSIAGTSVVTLGATNVLGSDSGTVTITVVDLAPPPPGTQPQIISPSNTTGMVGTAFSYAIQATNTPTAYAASGLPSGLTIDTATGLITGIPVTSATTNVTMSASNADGTDTETLQVSISTSSGSPPPSGPSPDTQTNTGASCGSGSGLSALALFAFFTWLVALRVQRHSH